MRATRSSNSLELSFRGCASAAKADASRSRRVENRRAMTMFRWPAPCHALASQRFMLQRAHAIEQVENDGDSGHIDPQRFAQPHDLAKARHNRGIEEKCGTFACHGLDQSVFDAALNHRRMQARATCEMVQ